MLFEVVIFYIFKVGSNKYHVCDTRFESVLPIICGAANGFVPC